MVDVSVSKEGYLATVDVLGTPLRVTDYVSFSDFCHRKALASEVFSVDFTNVHIVAMRRADLAFRELTATVDYFVPDGMPLVWCMNRAEAGLRDRVYGPTFLRVCLERSTAGILTISWAVRTRVLLS